MEKRRASVKLREAGVGVDRSDVTVTFRLNLWTRQETDRKRDNDKVGEDQQTVKAANSY